MANSDYIGNIIGPRGYSVAAAIISEADQRLRLTLSSGEVLDAGVARGPQGLNGVNGVENDIAVAGYLSTPSATQTAADDRYARGISVATYGASPAATPSVNVTAIRDAFNAAVSFGAAVYIPGGDYQINDSLVVPANIKVYGDGRTSIITQTVWPKPAFDCRNNPGVTIDDLRGVNIATRVETGWMTLVRGNTEKNQSAFVLTNANDTIVRSCSETGFNVGVYIDNWDDTAGIAGTVNTSGCEVIDFGVDDSEFGVHARNFNGLTIRNVTGNYLSPSDGSQSPHLLYLGTNEDQNNNGLTVSDCRAWDSMGGAAYQIKGVNSGTVSGLMATGCEGILSLLTIRDVTITNVISRDDKTRVDTVGASLSMGTANLLERVTISNVNIEMANDARAVRMLAGLDCKLIDPTVTVSHTTDNDDADIEVRGGWEVVRPKVINSGSKAWRGVSLWTAEGGILRDPTCVNVRVGAEVRGSTVGAVAYVDPAKITLHPTSGLHKLEQLSSTGRMITPDHLAAQYGSANLIAAQFDVSRGSAGSLSDGTETGGAWEIMSGTWVVADSAAACTTAAASTAVLDVGTPNAEVLSNVTTVNVHSLALRVVAATTFLGIRMNTGTGQLELTKVVSGAQTVIGTPYVTPLTVGRRYQIGARLYGSKVEVLLNGAMVIQHTLAGGDEVTFGTATKFGLRSSSVSLAGSWHDLVINKL